MVVRVDWTGWQPVRRGMGGGCCHIETALGLQQLDWFLHMRDCKVKLHIKMIVCYLYVPLEVTNAMSLYLHLIVW